MFSHRLISYSYPVMKGQLMRFAARIFAGGILAAGMVAVPAVAANAVPSYTVTWVSTYGSNSQTYSCSGGAQISPGDNVSKVSNGCGGRIWLHQYYSEPGNAGYGNSYCINPGAVAYGFSPQYGDMTQVQPTVNAATCDSGTVVWVQWTNGESQRYSCVEGFWTTSLPDAVLSLTNTCNTRIWVHENAGGGGITACVSPAHYPGNTFDNNAVPPMAQFQISYNQAPCSAG
jgi:hypothetical protein